MANELALQQQTINNLKQLAEPIQKKIGVDYNGLDERLGFCFMLLLNKLVDSYQELRMYSNYLKERFKLAMLECRNWFMDWQLTRLYLF